MALGRSRPGCTALVVPSRGGKTSDAKSAAGGPNIIFLLADDLGYGDIGAFGQRKFRTPNLDQLAKDGMRLTHHDSGQNICAPSRCVLMTGKHPGHASIRSNEFNITSFSFSDGRPRYWPT